MAMLDYYCTIESPLGELVLMASEIGLTGIYLPVQISIQDVQQAEYNPSRFTSVIQQLKEYFAGARRSFDVSLALIGTDFQKRVWEALRTLQYGETKSYGEIATMLKQPKAVRAVGGAIGKNPISIIVPCHRVIGSNGSLTGYAGGLDAKKWLLGLEANR